MGILEEILLDYYRCRTLESLTAQEVDEYLYLEVKLGREKLERAKRWI